MKREEIAFHNAWCAWLASAEFMAGRDAVAARLSRVLNCAVTLHAEACGIEDGAAARALAAGSPFSLVAGAAGGLRGVVVSSRLLPSVALRRLAGSEKLSVSQTFCRAALELCTLHAAAAWSSHAGIRVAVDAAPGAVEKIPDALGYVRIRVTVNIAGDGADTTLFVPAAPPPKARAASFVPTATCDASVLLDVEPLDLGRLRGLIPGDLVVAWPDGPAPRATVSIRCEDGTAIESTVDTGALLRDGTVLITERAMEVAMDEATVTEEAAPAAQSLDGLRLPVRLDVAAFKITAGELARLAPGQVIECRADLSRAVKMYVCGALFAEGAVETHEGFNGFRVEKVF